MKDMELRVGEVSPDVIVGEKAGTARDVEDMKRLGKQQLFKRNFNLPSILGFSMIAMSTWESVLATVAFGLGNGGTSGLVYTYIGVWIMFILVIVSMAEMASMAPTSGGQYHWISEFAPRQYQRELSYFVGWLSVLGWQLGVAITAFGAGTQIQGLVVLGFPETYVFERWHGTLMAMCITAGSALFNTFLPRHLPKVEYAILVLHFVGFFVILICLWVMAPVKTPHEGVWNSFADAGGWGSTGGACLVGMITNVVSFVGGDAAAHMSEELRSASKTLPRAMLFTIIANGATGFIMLVTFCYTMGDIDTALTTPTGYPIIEVFHSATGSVAGANGLMSFLIILSICSNLSNMAGASRQLFAFARDGALPGSGWISRVKVGKDAPVNAVVVTMFVAWALHCINIGSTIAWNIINSVGAVALATSYVVCIASLLYRRLNGPLLHAYFRMGRTSGILINGTAVALMLLALVMAFFPSSAQPTTENMNWACAVYGGVLLVALVHYLVWARRSFVSPIDQVKLRAGEVSETLVVGEPLSKA